MRNIVFFGGPAYSGKSTTINDIIELNSNHIDISVYSFDSVRQLIIEKPIYFFTGLGQWNAEFKIEFMRLFASCGHNDEVKFLLHVESELCARGYINNIFLYHYSLLKDYCAISYMAKGINKNKQKQLTLIEGRFTTKVMRKATIDFLKPSIKDFNQTPMFFYFNLPLKVLLKRKEKKKVRAEHIKQINKQYIKRSFLSQEIMKHGELQHINTHIIKGSKHQIEIPNIVLNLSK